MTIQSVIWAMTLLASIFFIILTTTLPRTNGLGGVFNIAAYCVLVIDVVICILEPHIIRETIFRTSEHIDENTINA